MTKIDAVLLVGPTGAGKTPLGDAMAESGVGNRRCLHFDFGANLRRIAAGSDVPDTFDDDDLHIVREVLTGGALLEDESFHIAEKILHAFMADMAIGDRDLLILNGLPRHVGQARDVDRLVHIGAILSLECTPDIVRARIHRNTGGDRTDRLDDSLAEIQTKLKIFQERTCPLLQYYANKGVPIHRLTVGTETTPSQMLDMAVSYMGQRHD
jgi:adenylate kinase family enzyme